MHSSDITIHKAIVHNVSNAGVYVKIPSLLGASEVIALHEPSISDYRWPPTIGDQILVAVEGDNFNRVYAILNVNNQPDNTFEIADGSITTSKIADGSVTTAKIANGSVTTAKLGLTELKLSATVSVSGSSNDNLITWSTEDSDANNFITTPSYILTVPAGCGGMYAIALRAYISGGNSANTITLDKISINYVLVNTASDAAAVSNGYAYQSLNAYLSEGDTLIFYYSRNPWSGATTSTINFTLWMTRIMD